eukprot:GHVT01024800.1.p1 GENE.GHVT01024800.1~~GHVT01024800.1.p1  ORF type:complete len:276 (+),score=33.70 GHVT01024800.1:1011-1838(+)
MIRFAPANGVPEPPSLDIDRISDHLAVASSIGRSDTAPESSTPRTGDGASQPTAVQPLISMEPVSPTQEDAMVYGAEDPPFNGEQLSAPPRAFAPTPSPHPPSAPSFSSDVQAIAAADAQLFRDDGAGSMMAAQMMLQRPAESDAVIALGQEFLPLRGPMSADDPINIAVARSEQKAAAASLKQYLDANSPTVNGPYRLRWQEWPEGTTHLPPWYYDYATGLEIPPMLDVYRQRRNPARPIYAQVDFAPTPGGASLSSSQVYDPTSRDATVPTQS